MMRLDTLASILTYVALRAFAEPTPAALAISDPKTPPFTIKGNGIRGLAAATMCHTNDTIAFFTGDKRFYIRGIDY